MTFIIYATAQTLVNERDQYMCTGTTSTGYNYCTSRISQVKGDFGTVMDACRANKKCVAIDYSSTQKYGHLCSTIVTSSTSSNNYRFCKLLDRYRSPGMIGKCVNIGWASAATITYGAGNTYMKQMEECAAYSRWVFKNGNTEERTYVGYAWEFGRSPPCYALTKANYDAAIKAKNSNNSGKRWVCSTENEYKDESMGCFESKRWKPHANLKSQQTRCAEVWKVSGGMQCLRPQVKYGSTWGGIPGSRSGNDYNKWCEYLGYSGKAVETKFYYSATRTCPSANNNGRLYWSSSYNDSGYYKWIDWQDGSWKTSGTTYTGLSYTCNGSDMLYSITCAGECTNEPPTLSPTMQPKCGDGRSLCEISEAFYKAEKNVERIRNTVGRCETEGEVIFLKRYDQNWVFVTDTPKSAYRDMIDFLLHAHTVLDGGHDMTIHYQHKTRDGKSHEMRITDDMDLYSAIRMQTIGLGHDFTELHVNVETDIPTSAPTTKTPTSAPTDPTPQPTFDIDTVTFQKQDNINWMVGKLKTLKNRKFGTLLYRMSVHGKSASNFHSKVDGKGQHLCSFLRDKEDTVQVFGSYSDMSWASSGGYSSCSGCFLWIAQEKTYKQYIGTVYRNTGNAVYRSSSYGPCFGGGHDFCVNSPSSPYGYTSWGHAYKAPNNGYPWYIGGKSTFYIKDWECWTTPSISG